MHHYQQKFIELALSCRALRFGEFTLKSGRISPYFFNAGLFNSGRALEIMGECYAAAIIKSGIRYDGLFGPAYKGIPLVSLLAAALFRLHDLDVSYTFNRKEAKDHGEGGLLVGAPLKNNVVIVDDVITAGTAIREAMQIVKTEQATCAGVIVALDRQEKGQHDMSAIQEITQNDNIPVVSIMTLDGLIEFLELSNEYSQELIAMKGYRQQYGV